MLGIIENCTACQACIQVCPKHCIELDTNYKIKTDNSECINCGLCEKVCQINNSPNTYIPIEIYAAHNKNKDELMQSSSGGIGALLLKNCLKRGYKVFSAVNNENIIPVIDEISLSNFNSALKSKYCFSDINSSYLKVKEILLTGVKVLFLALPCQIVGLKLFLRKEYNNLFCVDLFCHGAPSPIELNKHLLYKGRRNKVIDVQFRDKKISKWGNYCYSFKYSDGSSSSGPALCDFYFSNFIRGSFFRECCYKCKYASFKRCGDLSIGDYWHIVPKKIDRNTNGISAVLVNTEKGRLLWNLINDFCEIEQGTKAGVETATHAVVKPLIKPSDYNIYTSQKLYNKKAMVYELSPKQIIRLLRFKLGL